jgi:hypothetical protein
MKGVVLVVPTSLIAESMTRQTKSYLGRAVLVLDQVFTRVSPNRLRTFKREYPEGSID